MNTIFQSLDELVGAHPEALRRIYEGGSVAEPNTLGDAPRGRLLAIEAGQGAFMLVRDALRLLGGDRSPWQGKAFEPGGDVGQNVVLGRRAFPFRVELGDSIVDARPTLLFRYDEPGHGNPWPVRALRDELRTVNAGIAIGPIVLLQAQPRVVAWFGLERR
jgi:hypothetical protein